MYEEPLSCYRSSVAVQSRLLRHDTVSLHGKFSMLPKTLFSDCVTFDYEDTVLHTNRVSQELRSLLWDLISELILSQNTHGSNWQRFRSYEFLKYSK